MLKGDKYPSGNKKYIRVLFKEWNLSPLFVQNE